MKIKLEVITPEKKFLEKEVYLAEFTTINGEIGVMQGHKNLSSFIAPGMLHIYQSDSKIEESFFIADGCFTATNDILKIMVSNAFCLKDVDKTEISAKLESLNEKLDLDGVDKIHLKQQIKNYETILKLLESSKKH